MTSCARPNGHWGISLDMSTGPVPTLCTYSGPVCAAANHKVRPRTHSMFAWIVRFIKAGAHALGLDAHFPQHKEAVNTQTQRGLQYTSCHIWPTAKKNRVRRRCCLGFSLGINWLIERKMNILQNNPNMRNGLLHGREESEGTEGIWQIAAFMDNLLGKVHMHVFLNGMQSPLRNGGQYNVPRVLRFWMRETILTLAKGFS